MWTCDVPRLGFYSPWRAWISVLRPVELYSASLVSVRKNVTISCWLALSLARSNVSCIRLQWLQVVESLLQLQNVVYEVHKIIHDALSDRRWVVLYQPGGDFSVLLHILNAAESHQWLIFSFPATSTVTRQFSRVIHSILVLMSGLLAAWGRPERAVLVIFATPLLHFLYIYTRISVDVRHIASSLCDEYLEVSHHHYLEERITARSSCLVHS